LTTFGVKKPGEPWVGFPNNRMYNIVFDYIRENSVGVVTPVE